jgi:hypothetical protein
MTTHELARKLLALPDITVTVWDAGGDYEADIGDLNEWPGRIYIEAGTAWERAVSSNG